MIRFSGGKQKTQQEYLLADKAASVLPVAFSLMASFMSAITLLGVTMENYTHGTQFVLINLSYLLSTPVAAYLFLPVFHNLQSASVYRWVQLLLLPPLPPLPPPALPLGPSGIVGVTSCRRRTSGGGGPMRSSLTTSCM